MKAHELLTDPRRFTTGTLARDKKGEACGTLKGSGAVKFDALGAIFYCYQNGAHNQPLKKDGPTPCGKAREIAKEMFNTTLGRLNYQEALAVLRAADV